MGREKKNNNNKGKKPSVCQRYNNFFVCRQEKKKKKLVSTSLAHHCTSGVHNTGNNNIILRRENAYKRRVMYLRLEIGIGRTNESRHRTILEPKQNLFGTETERFRSRNSRSDHTGRAQCRQKQILLWDSTKAVSNQ